MTADVQDTVQILAAASALGGLGLWLALPRGGKGGRRLGLLLGIVALGLFGWQLPAVGGVGEHSLFLALAAVTVVSAAATVTARNPVYSAIWFALSLMGTAALFLCQGAQFLGVATVVVYAGAILVTFLFVLMLANPSGQAHYDRLSWEAFLSAGAGAVLVGMLTTVLAGSLGDMQPAVAQRRPTSILTPMNMRTGTPIRQWIEPLAAACWPSSTWRTWERSLSGRHLVALEVAGTLLLAALVGAVAITAHGKAGQGLPAQSQPAPTGSEGVAHG